MAVIGAGAPANAGAIDRAGDPAAAVRRSRCDSLGPGSTTPDSCVRIRGYIAADADPAPDAPIGEAPAPFGPLDAPGIVAIVRASGGAKLTPSPDRFFVPASQGDSAR